ncbi:hypothetical protein J3R82DRAFT_481 [Butyriboletus roseoflavus]|nr:hypothetical protein J3R82DRAFT_481 [Butyriboletus roseoflavus]
MNKLVTAFFSSCPSIACFIQLQTDAVELPNAPPPMATHLARPHSHLSNRAKVRAALERKPVFRSVLESPFQISWPSVPVNVQNVVLAHLVAALENIPSRAQSSRKSSQKTGISGQQANVDILEEVEPEYGHIQTNLSGALPHFVIGINTVTRALESQLRNTRKHVVVDSAQDSASRNGDQRPSSAPSPIVVVFVCCADVDPSALVDHIPHLVAGCNSLRNATQPTKLVPLPKGSEPTISQILGVRRAAVVAFRHGSPLSESFRDILESIPTISAPWLCPSGTQLPLQLVPTHIKQLRTTAPIDMKGAREQRSKARTAAKNDISSSSRSVRRKPRLTLTTG